MTRPRRSRPPPNAARPASSRGGKRRLAAIACAAAGCAVVLASWLVYRTRAKSITQASHAAVDPPIPNLSGSEVAVRDLIEQTRQAVLHQRSSTRAWGRYGQVLHVHSFHPEAIAAYRQARSLNPREFRPAYYLARLLDITGADLDGAVSLYREAAKLEPDYAPLYVHLGAALTRKGDFPSAVEAFSVAIRLLPEMPDGHRGRGQTLLKLANNEAAIRDLEAAVRLRPRDGPAHAALAQAYARLGNQARSRELAERARGLTDPVYLSDPYLDEVSQLGVSVSIRWQRSLDNIRMGEFKKALDELQQVAKSRADDPQVFVRMGECLERTGQPLAALPHYERALSLRGDLSQAHLRIGVILFSTGRLEDALKHLRTALPEAKEPDKVRVIIATILRRLGRPAEDLPELESASPATQSSP